MLESAAVAYQSFTSNSTGGQTPRAKRDKPMALHYPRGMDQFDPVTGERLYMALWLNTYGTPDGGNIWQGERNTFILKRFNVHPWTYKACLMDQCMYYLAYTTTEPVPESEAAETKERSSSVPEFQKQLYRGTDLLCKSLYLSVMGLIVN